MRDFKYVIYQDGDHYVAQCLNVDVSSFGDTLDAARKNIHEAVELYFEDNDAVDYRHIPMAFIANDQLNA